MSTTPPDALVRLPRWPWVVLGLGLVWTALIRVPLVLNAEDHLDSDLAVDGLTLLDATSGRWRWHYPGTPHVGILPVLFSFPQAIAWGPSASTLVSGGTVIWLFIVAATFWLAWRAYSPAVAAWAIVPLVFSSTGTIWLSGRITGGHLLTLAWHTLALVGLYSCLSRGGRLRAGALGFWCGLGLYLDAMFLLTVAGLVPAAFLAWFFQGRSRLPIAPAVLFLLGLVAGLAPHLVGRFVDPRDAYPSQFTASVEQSAIFEHQRLLAFRCLPRLIAGTELRDVEARLLGPGDPASAALPSAPDRQARPGLPRSEECLAVLVVATFIVAVVRLALDLFWADQAARRAISFSTICSAILNVVAFLAYRNIFNSDNYRYLIYLLTPWSLGFGLLMGDLLRRGTRGRVAAGLVFAALSLGMTGSSLVWYQHTLHYIDKAWRVVSVHPAAWFELPLGPVRQQHTPNARPSIVPPDVTHVFGDYWDVYRTAFLSKNKVVGIPYPMYPNRFAGWSRGLGRDQGKLLVLGLRREPESGQAQWRAPELGERHKVIDHRTTVNWPSAFRTVWQKDGRDPAELKYLRVIVAEPDRAGR
jgi:hypothetical protein